MKLPVSKIPTFNHTFYLISYLISLSMTPIRRSNRVSKPRDYLDPSPPRRRQQPAFTIYTEPPKDLHTQLSDLGSGSDLGSSSYLDSGSVEKLGQNTGACSGNCMSDSDS